MATRKNMGPDRDKDEGAANTRNANARNVNARYADARDASARYAAQQEFENAARVSEAPGFGGSGLFSQDIRYGLRILWKNPVYSVISILTLALGIGASTAIFSVVYGVLLRSLPFHQPDRIVRVWELDSKGRPMRFTDPNAEDLRAQSRTLQGMAEMRSDEVAVAVGDEPDRFHVAVVSSDFFSVMGVTPVVGRLFSPDEQKYGAPATALVSYSYWQNYLHGATELGSIPFTIAKVPTTIIGVLPQGFSYPEDSRVWTPRERELRTPSRSAHNWNVIARLRGGYTLDEARSESSGIAKRIYQQFGPHDIDMADASMLPLQDAMTSDVKPALLVLLAVAGLLLLVACANVINLSLAQSSARSNELAVRTALGASRARMVRQFLVESLLLCLCGGFLGVLGAYIGVHSLLAVAPSNIPRLNEVSVNLPVLLFALGLCLIVAVGLGILTAMRTTSGDVQASLTEGGRRQSPAARSQRTGRIIVVAQVAITLTLLVGAGLLGRSMLRVLSIHPGFETQNVVTMEMELPDLTEVRMEPQRVQFIDQLISQLQTLPGVQSVGGTAALPLRSDIADGAFAILNPQQLTPAQHDLIDRSPKFPLGTSDAVFQSESGKFIDELFRNQLRTGYADYIVASQGYFQSIGIPLLQGRLFNDADTPSSPHVAVISDSVARQKWPDQNPIGQTIEYGNMDGDLRPITIVGVVGDVRTRSVEARPRPTVYVDYRQRPRTTSEFDMVVRTTSDPAGIFSSARRILAELDPTIPPKFNTFSQVFSESLNNRRFNLLLVGLFAGAALLLAMAGIFGVLAYSVAQRTREIGVRIALGATTGNVLKLVLGQGLATTLVGTVVGLIGSFLLTRTMRSLLFEISPADPLTLLGVAVLLVLVALLACFIPARRATRVDPMVALRYD